MKKYIFSLILTMLYQLILAQGCRIWSNDNDSVRSKKAELALKSVITQSNYIVEAFFIQTNDFYYIKEDDQTYYRTFMRVTKVLRGEDLHVGDTLISIWKQQDKGNGPPEIHIFNNLEPRLWYDAKSTSCIFLTASKYPGEPVPDEWSRFKHTTYIPSSIGYFAACYDSHIGINQKYVAVDIERLIFNSRYEWYQYLKQFPDLKVPENY